MLIMFKHHLNTLKVVDLLRTINEETWHWYNDHVGQKKCPVVDTWWQTETGGIMSCSVAFVTNETNLCDITATGSSGSIDG
jgi:acetyl-CoA synthetase